MTTLNTYVAAATAARGPIMKPGVQLTLAALALAMAPWPLWAGEAAPAPEPKLVLAQWLSLYLARRKIGYATQTLSEFPDRGRRLETQTFLVKAGQPDRFGYCKMITADVDARFRPRALECRVVSGERSWQVAGRIEDGELVLVRTVGEKSATARIPLDDDVTFLSWTLQATLLGGGAGEAKRYLAIDESLGALLPDPCVVQVLGPRALAPEPGGQPVGGTGVVWACGPEQVAHLVGAGGRIVRSLWQSSPLVAQATSFMEAQRLRDTADGPAGPPIEGFDGQRYSDARRGFSLRVPPYPFLAHIAPASGVIAITDLTGEGSVTAQMAFLPRPATGAEDADAHRVADLVQRGWSARFENVQAAPATTERIADQTAQVIEGTLRLGCTTFFFRNYFLASDGRAYFVSALAADRPVSSEPVLAGDVVQSLRLSAPEGPLPLLAGGDLLRSPYHGFELRRPSSRWIIPQHVDGPAMVLELARQDHAAVALLRVLTPRPEQSFESFVKDQAQLVADNLGGDKPEPRPVNLGGRAGYEIDYEARKAISDRPGRCAAIYTRHGTRVMALVLIAATGADPSAARELQEIRESLKFIEPDASK
ncbi:MAG: hypothetical protein NTX87_04095 [Planctomycetota bacterium]|nr:hypothetical protein [Planctomycetota bacterium]